MSKEDSEICFDCINLFNIEIAYDSTDHFSLMCSKCKSACNIKRIKTTKGIQVDWNGTKDNVTHILVYCKKCKKVVDIKELINELEEIKCKKPLNKQ